jgi:hypothetical protein
MGARPSQRTLEQFGGDEPLEDHDWQTLVALGDRVDRASG